MKQDGNDSDCQKRHDRRAGGVCGPHSSVSLILDEPIEAPQGAEYLDIIFIVGAQFHAEALRHDQGDFQHVDRIKAEPFLVKRGPRIDLTSRNLQIKGRYDQAGKLGFLDRLRSVVNAH
jgi:hypothetical protein